MSFDKISIIGLGYIGLPTAAIFASRKLNVIGVDICQKTVDIINRGEIHIVEPDLDMVVHAAVSEGYLKATTQAEKSDAFIIAVPTPFNENYEPDLSYIKSACESIAPVLCKGNLVILESTSPVGATEQMRDWLAELRPDLTFPVKASDQPDVFVAHCPERVLPGKIMRELIENDRIIGGITSACAELSTQLYKSFVDGECIQTNARTAEMAKLTENSFRDVNIAFANELSMICHDLQIDVWELIQLANRHPRVNILQPGCGVGGHCIAVDPWFIVNSNPEKARLIKTARVVNDLKPDWVIDNVKASVAEHLNKHPNTALGNLKVACMGLSFKPDIDDLRESPALAITEAINHWFQGELMVCEPNIEALPASLSGLNLVTTEYAVDNADIIVVLVKHKEFIELKTQIATKEYFDCVGLLA